MPKVVNFAIDCLRSGRLLESYAECQVIRHGKKIVNTTRAHLLLQE